MLRVLAFRRSCHGALSILDNLLFLTVIPRCTFSSFNILRFFGLRSVSLTVLKVSCAFSLAVFSAVFPSQTSVSQETGFPNVLYLPVLCYSPPSLCLDTFQVQIFKFKISFSLPVVTSESSGKMYFRYIVSVIIERQPFQTSFT